MAPRHGNGGKAGTGQSNRRGGCGGGAGGKHRERRRDRVRDEDGQFVETVDGETVLSVFEAVAGPVVTTTDVSDVLGVSTESARQKLNDLVGGGKLRRRKTGRTVVYWRVE
ncbi:FaeA/PapI family transcriptional regulator [Halapricum desulfuricans]|uniref:Putative transcriptional regulator, contains HTH domain n=1 Tax=Halapricum desulfuricans TaxID=2841257 RepID=A0A897NN97_9EURY|nr:FaeA/PapI family transcriptional regulator [Halapricum desulfuricans]QSG14232.1 putative transcriptional regulator, contains HTH domain [Halapricum desulfuricans]